MQIAILSFFHYFTYMFKKRNSVFEVEEGKFLSPKFELNNEKIEGIIVGKAIYDGDIKLDELAKEIDA